jgi:hypothetical protein
MMHGDVLQRMCFLNALPADLQGLPDSDLAFLGPGTTFIVIVLCLSFSDSA